MMSSLSWTSRFVCSVFLYTFPEYQATSGITGKCDCTFDGKVYNLSSLESTNEEKPRFYRKRKDNYMVSYNPCSSFTFETKLGDCTDDVAICLSSDSSDQNIGKQSTATCGEDDGGKYLEYSNPIAVPSWKAVVYLNCNKTRKSPDSANFEVINVLGDRKKSRRTFRLSHICACGDGCTSDPKNKQSKAKKIVLPVGIIAGVIIIAVPLIIWIYRRRQRNNNPPVIDREIRGYETINNITSQAEGRNRKDTNIRRNVSPPISVSSRSCSDIKELSKDKFHYENDGGRASAPV